MRNYSLERKQNFRQAAVIPLVSSNGSCLLIPISIGMAAFDGTPLSVWPKVFPWDTRTIQHDEKVILRKVETKYFIPIWLHAKGVAQKPWDVSVLNIM